MTGAKVTDISEAAIEEFRRVDGDSRLSARWWADRLGVSERQVVRWRTKGMKPAVKTALRLISVCRQFDSRSPALMATFRGENSSIDKSRRSKGAKFIAPWRPPNSRMLLWRASCGSLERSYWPSRDLAAFWFNETNRSLYPDSAVRLALDGELETLECSNCGTLSELVVWCELLYSSFHDQVLEERALCRDCRKHFRPLRFSLECYPDREEFRRAFPPRKKVRREAKKAASAEQPRRAPQRRGPKPGRDVIGECGCGGKIRAYSRGGEDLHAYCMRCWKYIGVVGKDGEFKQE